MEIIPYDSTVISKFSIDGNYNKIIRIPCIYTSDCADKYEHLHLKLLPDYTDEINVEYIYVIKDDEIPTGVVFVYGDALRPNEFFLFSKNLAQYLIDDDKFNNLSHSKFFFWRDARGKANIRLATTFVNLDLEYLQG